VARSAAKKRLVQVFRHIDELPELLDPIVQPAAAEPKAPR